MENNAQKVKLKITSIQLAGDEKSELESEYDGKLFIKDNAVHIFYRENDEDKTSCAIHAKRGEVQLVRKGETVSSKMSFEPQKVYKTVYRTAYGNMDLVIKPFKVLCAVNSGGGKIQLEYDMLLAGQRFFNSVTIYAEPVGQQKA